jgi:hypothetical protein
MTFFHKLFTSTIIQKQVLGRWERTNDALNTIKVYWANVDHCGTCTKETIPTASVKTPSASPSPSASETSLIKSKWSKHS